MEFIVEFATRTRTSYPCMFDEFARRTKFVSNRYHSECEFPWTRKSYMRVYVMRARVCVCV